MGPVSTEEQGPPHLAHHPVRGAASRPRERVNASKSLEWQSTRGHAESMTTHVWEQAPEAWPRPEQALLDQARTAALEALSDDTARPATERLLTFYDRDGNYAGATFVSLQPTSPSDLTAVDLHATSLLSVNIGPGATRRLLRPTATRKEVLDTLAALPDKDLLVVDPEDLLLMERFYLAVKAALSSPSAARPNAWVTASKLCARKRPSLFPVRDEVVCNHLGLIPPRGRGDYRIDWQVFRFLVGDRQVVEAIDARVDTARATSSDRDVEIDRERLRILDAALWTWAVRTS